MIVAMILAGGSGTRVGAQRPKQFIEVDGKPIVCHTINIYEQIDDIDEIVVVCHNEWIRYLSDAVDKLKFNKVCKIVGGGHTFQESVIAGLNALRVKDDDIVMIHYAASPFTSQKIVLDSIEVCRHHTCGISATPCMQLMGTYDGDNISHAAVDRDRIVQIACPQSFKAGYLKKLYSRACELGILNSTEPHPTSLMYAMGDPLYLSYGEQSNIKITTMSDVELFKRLIEAKHRN